jgi:hypothetical protein
MENPDDRHRRLRSRRNGPRSGDAEKRDELRRITLKTPSYFAQKIAQTVALPEVAPFQT